MGKKLVSPTSKRNRRRKNPKTTLMRLLLEALNLKLLLEEHPFLVRHLLMETEVPQVVLVARDPAEKVKVKLAPQRTVLLAKVKKT